jgi:hypothetical protein
MDACPSAGPPAWVYKRDGRLVPFEADKISRSLFAASESLGQPNAFLARELTDGIVHFLGADAESSVPTTAQVAELVTKVVRELGQPALAQAFADFVRHQAQKRPEEPAGARAAAQAARTGPALDELTSWIGASSSPGTLAWQAGGACLRAYALREVFTRDLAAAQEDGFLILGGLETPLELASSLVRPFQAGKETVETIEEARTVVGEMLAVDGLDYLLAQFSGAGEAVGGACIRDLAIGLRAFGLRAIVNLHTSTPPPWAGDLAEGPLFADQSVATPSEFRDSLADTVVDQWWKAGTAASRLRLDWHLGERDFAPAGMDQLARLARRTADGANLAFVFDRPRQPLTLAEGLDRRHPATLLTVGLNLPRLARLPGIHDDPAVFLQKLGSLARLALSAGVQKRDFLRRHGQKRSALAREFLLDRARLIVVPVGLEVAVRHLLNVGLCEGTAAVDFGRQMVERLAEVLTQDGQASHLETCLDSADGFSLKGPSDRPAGPLASLPMEDAAGLTPWDRTASIPSQLHTAGALHAAAGRGTAAVFLPPDKPLPVDELVGYLHLAWQESNVVRLRFLRPAQSQRQLVLGSW